MGLPSNSVSSFCVRSSLIWAFPRAADPDFKPINEKNDTCKLPIFWDTAGDLVNVDKGDGCYDSPFGRSAFGSRPIQLEY